MSDFDAWMKGQTKPKAETKTSPSTGGFDSWMKGETKPKASTLSTVLPTERQEFGRRPETFDRTLSRQTQSRLRPRSRIDWGHPVLDEEHEQQRLREAELHFQRRDREAFEKKPTLEQWKERARDAAARGGGSVSRMARQTLGLMTGVAKKMATPQNEFQVEDFPEWRKGEEGRMATLEQRRTGRPSSFATDVGEGIIESLPAASFATLGGMVTGGSLPAAMATGAGLSAAGADWSDPRRAAAQTAIGAVAPVLGGKAGQAIASPIVRRLAAPVAQSAARAGGELIGGGAGNVIGTGAEQLAFEGKLDPRELAKQGIIGAALNVPGAAGAGRRRPIMPEAEKLPQSRTPEGAIISPPSPLANRRLLPPARGEEIIPTEPLSRAVRDVVSPGAARRGVRQPQESLNPQPAQPVTVAQQPEVIPTVPPRVQPGPRQTAEIPRVPTAPTRQIQYPDAPATQEMPTFRQWLEAENAPTMELPVERSAQASPQVTEPQGPSSIPSSTVRPPKATDENIQALRSQQEELGRLAYDRRGDFTGDLRDEYDRLNSIIREYDNARAPKEFAPPPGGRPERGLSPEDRAAGREALQPRTGPMPETLTPGRKVTQEMQIPPALKPTEAFSSREDARQGHFERFDDQELVDEIRRMEDVRNQDIRGKSKLTPEQLEANRFDLKVAVEQQKERRRLQQQMGMEAGERIAPRTPTRFKKAEAAPETPATGMEGLRQYAKSLKEGEKPNAVRAVAAFLGRRPTSMAETNAVQGQLEAAGFNKLSDFVQSVRSPGAEVKRVEDAPFNYVLLADGTVQVSTGGKFEPNPTPDVMAKARQKLGLPAAKSEGRKIQHTAFGEVTEAASQKGVPRGKLLVVDTEGGEHVIQDPRTKGNQNASFVRSIPSEALPELQAANAPPPPRVGRERAPTAIDYAIPDEAMPELRGRHQVRGFGLGALFKRSPSRTELSETAGGIQTVAQLGNPRFVVRNVLQHVAFGKQERTATRLAAFIDWAYSKATGKGRQIAAPRGSDLASYVRNWGKAIQAHKSGQPLPGGQSSIQHTANANKIDRAINKVMTWMNEIPDAANWQTRFEDSLKSIVDASQKSKSPLNMTDAIDQATMEANKAALRDSNFVSSALLKLKDGLNTLSSPIFGTDKFGAGDFILKYAQTPGALLKRGLERSPLGLFEVAKQAATPGPFRRRNTFLALSRVAEGAATGAGLGAALAAAGVLVGPEEESRTGKAMEREEGKRGYSLNTSALRRLVTGESTEMAEGDTLYSIDWLQPWAMNLSAGAAVYNLHKDGKLGAGEGAKATGEAVYNSLARTLDVMGDQSVLKNLSRYMSRTTGETFADQVLSFAKSVGLDIPSSFVPSLARQARQVVDPFERDTRAEQRGGFRGFMEEAGNRALAQLPGVSETFPKRPSLLTGEDRKTALGEMSSLSRTAAQFSPANVSTFTPRAVAREISRLNKAGESVSVSFPAPQKGEATSNLRSRERRFAESFSKLSQEMIADPLYKEADNQMKAAAFAGLKRYLRNLEKEDFEEKGIDEIIEAAIETVEKRRDKEDQ